MLENIIALYNRKYAPEKYEIKKDQNIDGKPNVIYSNDSLEDLRSFAHLVVWEATKLYIAKNKKAYKDRFSFCIFASEQVKFRLRLQVRELNSNRRYGCLPKSDDIRKIYTVLPQWKINLNLEKGLEDKHYEEIAKKYNLDIKTIRAVDKFITGHSISGDKPAFNQEGNETNFWEILEKSQTELSDEGIEDKLNKKNEHNLFREIKNKFLKKLSLRDREILNYTKFKDIYHHKNNKLNMVELARKHQISSERVRQISNNLFKKFEDEIKKYREDLGY